MFRIALYRQSANDPVDAIGPSRLLAALPGTSSHADDATRIVMALVDVDEGTGLDEGTGPYANWDHDQIRRHGIDRLDLFEIPRVAGRWTLDYSAWLDRLNADVPQDQMAPAVTGGQAYPFLCETGRIAQEPIPERVQREHLDYVTRRARNLLLGGWLERGESFGDGAALPEVCGIFIYQVDSFEEADRLGWQDPTAIAGFWTPLSFEPACVAAEC